MMQKIQFTRREFASHVHRSILVNACAACGALTGAMAAELKVTLEDVATSSGHVLVAVCTPETFLRRGAPTPAALPRRAARQVVVRGIDPGVYAAGVSRPERQPRSGSQLPWCRRRAWASATMLRCGLDRRASTMRRSRSAPAALRPVCGCATSTDGEAPVATHGAPSAPAGREPHRARHRPCRAPPSLRRARREGIGETQSDRLRSLADNAVEAAATQADGLETGELEQSSAPRVRP